MTGRRSAAKLTKRRARWLQLEHDFFQSQWAMSALRRSYAATLNDRELCWPLPADWARKFTDALRAEAATAKLSAPAPETGSAIDWLELAIRLGRVPKSVVKTRPKLEAEHG